MILTSIIAAAALQAAPAPQLAGQWNGVLSVGGQSLRIVLRVDPTGAAVVDSPDQGASGIPAVGPTVEGGVVRFSVPAVRAAFEGVLAEDGRSITGALTQGSSRVLELLGLDDGRGSGVLTWLLGLVLAAVVDVVIFLWLLRVVPSVSHPLRRLLPGALFGAAGFEALKLLGGYYLSLISGSVTASAFGGAVGLLVWINLLGRVSFFTAAWTATLRRIEAPPAPQVDAAPVAA